jgi:Tol biopolymer transport system component
MEIQMKIYSLSICLIVILTLAACGDATHAPDASTPTITPIPEPTAFAGSYGRRIAFIGYPPGESTFQIFSVLPNGHDLTQLTQHPDGVDNLMWSPNGEMIAFFSTVNGRNRVYTMNADGSNQVMVAETLPGQVFGIHWSADSTWMYASYYSSSNHAFLYTTAINLPNGNKEDIAMVPRVWSPDGMTVLGIAYPDDDNCGDLAIMDRDHSITRVITSSLECEYPIEWSPDGSEILYISEESAMVPGTFLSANSLYVARPDGSNPLNVTEGFTGYIYTAHWTPDGTWIIFNASLFDDRRNPFYRVRPDGSELGLITLEEDPVQFQAWSPSGRQGLLFTRNFTEDTSRIYLLDLDAWDLVPITDGSQFGVPTAFSPDGRWILMRSYTGGGNYLFSIEGSEWISLDEGIANSGRASWQP